MGLEDDLYREIILDHYRSPRNRRDLPSPPAVRAEGFNPLCGDEIVVFIDVDDDGIITDVGIGGQGCSISQSSASMMSAAITGHTMAEARDLIDSFKSMLSVHEREIGGDGSEAEAETDEVLDPNDPAAVRRLGDLLALRGVVKFPVRIKCATLSWNTLAQALDDADATSETT